MNIMPTSKETLAKHLVELSNDEADLKELMKLPFQTLVFAYEGLLMNTLTDKIPVGA